MKKIEKSIEVNVPVSTAYNQWTQFEDFPKFMDGVEEVRQLSDDKLYWRAQIGGHEVEWNARIVDQEPDQRISWISTSGDHNEGLVTFTPLGPNETRVTLTMTYEPEGLLEKVGSAVGIPDGKVEKDLENFKEFIESRGVESGAWRGKI